MLSSVSAIAHNIVAFNATSNTLTTPRHSGAGTLPIRQWILTGDEGKSNIKYFKGGYNPQIYIRAVTALRPKYHQPGETRTHPWPLPKPVDTLENGWLDITILNGWNLTQNI